MALRGHRSFCIAEQITSTFLLSTFCLLLFLELLLQIIKDAFKACLIGQHCRHGPKRTKNAACNAGNPAALVVAASLHAAWNVQLPVCAYSCRL
jgi:hypothetical protein